MDSNTTIYTEKPRKFKVYDTIKDLPPSNLAPLTKSKRILPNGRTNENGYVTISNIIKYVPIERTAVSVKLDLQKNSIRIHGSNDFLDVDTASIDDFKFAKLCPKTNQLYDTLDNSRVTKSNNS